MTRYFPMNTSGEYAYVFADTPGAALRCVDTFAGPGAFDQAVKRASELQRQEDGKVAA